MVFLKLKQRNGSLPPNLCDFKCDFNLISNNSCFRRLRKEVQSLKQPYLKRRRRRKQQLKWLRRKKFSTSRYYFNVCFKFYLQNCMKTKTNCGVWFSSPFIWWTRSMIYTRFCFSFGDIQDRYWKRMLTLLKFFFS